MGRRGRQPATTKEKKLLGNPGRRPLNDNEPQPTGPPTAPDHLDTYAKMVWLRIMVSMPDGVYTAADTDTLTAFVDQCSIYRTACLELAKLDPEKWVADGKITPWLRVKNDAAAKIATLGTRLGLNPTARSAIQMPEKKANNKFGRLTAVGGKGKK